MITNTPDRYIQCPRCYGKGKIYDTICRKCKGKAVVLISEIDSTHINE